MIQPYDYYHACESVAWTLSDLKRNIEIIETFAAANGYRVFWRGQVNHEWGLVSSLVRRLSAASIVDDQLLDRVEQALLDEASAWIRDLAADPYKEPLAKLAYLQHHGVPTRLLDFTANPWMAIFFATESLDAIDGRVFAIIVNDSDVLSATPVGAPWRAYKTNEVRVFDPAAAGIAFSRLEAQNGVLALGRLPSTQPHREARDILLQGQRSLLAEEVRRILSLPFKLLPFEPTAEENRVPKAARAPFGLTFRIHVDKESVRRDLAGRSAGRRISPPGRSATHSSVYPDASGMVAHSKIIRGLEKGVLVVDHLRTE